MSPLHENIFDGQGRTTDVSGSGVLWLHLDQKDPADRRWLYEDSGIDSVLAEALLADDTRPRSLVSGDGLFLILRGINVANEGDPEDMVALRMWLEGDRSHHPAPQAGGGVGHPGVLRQRWGAQGHR